MFERPEWATREPLPGKAGYEAYLAYEDQQIAFWTAYAASDVGPDEALDHPERDEVRRPPTTQQ